MAQGPLQDTPQPQGDRPGTQGCSHSPGWSRAAACPANSSALPLSRQPSPAGIPQLQGSGMLSGSVKASESRAGSQVTFCSCHGTSGIFQQLHFLQMPLTAATQSHSSHSQGCRAKIHSLNCSNNLQEPNLRADSTQAPGAEGAGELPRLGLYMAFLKNLQQIFLTHPVALNLYETHSGYLLI